MTGEAVETVDPRGAAVQSVVPPLAHDRLRIFPGVIAGDVCDRIIERGTALTFEPGYLYDAESGGRFHDTNIRITSVAWFKERDWSYDLVRGYVQQVNAEWDFDLNDADPLQFAHYRKFDFFEWHRDILLVRQGPIRKVSVVVQLSAPETYRGGRLEFVDRDLGLIVPKAFFERGSVAVFSSLLRHRVTPLKEGERHSLTAWFKGPPFR